MIKESKSRSDAMKKYLNKELVMTKEDNGDFETSSKCWIYNSDYVDIDVNVKLNPKILVLSHNLKRYDSHLVMQELGKFNLKMNVISNGLKK